MPEKKDAKQEEKIPVTIIRRKGAAALVEFIEKGHVQRAIIPAEDIDVSPENTAQVPPILLEQGINYGAAWQVHISDVSVPASVIARALRDYGIWTVEDFRAKPDAVREALMSAFAPAVQEISAAVNRINHSEEVNNGK